MLLLRAGHIRQLRWWWGSPQHLPRWAGCPDGDVGPRQMPVDANAARVRRLSGWCPRCPL